MLEGRESTIWFFFFFFNGRATTEIYTLSLHDALPIYPGVGPEHSYLKDSGRAEYREVTDSQALEAFHLLCRTEGIIPALESSHAVHAAVELAKTLTPDQIILVCLSGRGDKDIDIVAQASGLQI